MHTVKKVSKLAGVSVRTLHYYDEIGLLKPSSVGANGYRHYDDAALFRLQQILLYREMDIELAQIRRILDDEAFDPFTALEQHRATLTRKIERLGTLIETVDTTLFHLLGEINMSNKHIFDGFNEEKQKQYEQQAIKEYGKESVQASMKRWNRYSKAEQAAIKQEGGAIYADIVANMEQGPQSAEVQALLGRWHQHLRHFYEPSMARLRGLGSSYHEHPDFNATFAAMHPELPAFLQQAINHYVDELEAAPPA